MAHVGWLIASMAFAGVSAGLLAPMGMDAVHAFRIRHRRRQRLASGQVQDIAGTVRTQAQAASVVVAVLDALRAAPHLRRLTGVLLAALPQMRRPAAALSELMRHRGVMCSEAEAVQVFLVAELLAGVVIAAALHSVLAAIIGMAACWLAPSQVLRWEQRRRASLLRSQAPDALRVLDSAVCAGMSLPRAFSYAASCTDAPLGEELAQVEYAIAAGQSIDEALHELQERVNVPELVFVTVAMEVQHRSGGSLHAIIGIAIESIRETFSLERSLEVKTAQARLSANVVATMPVVLLALLMVVSPGYLSSFLSSPIGVVMLMLAALLDAIGLLAIRSCMDVEV